MEYSKIVFSHSVASFFLFEIGDDEAVLCLPRKRLYTLAFKRTRLYCSEKRSAGKVFHSFTYVPTYPVLGD